MSVDFLVKCRDLKVLAGRLRAASPWHSWPTISPLYRLVSIAIAMLIYKHTNFLVYKQFRETKARKMARCKGRAIRFDATAIMRGLDFQSKFNIVGWFVECIQIISFSGLDKGSFDRWKMLFLYQFDPEPVRPIVLEILLLQCP